MRSGKDYFLGRSFKISNDIYTAWLLAEEKKTFSRIENVENRFFWQINLEKFSLIETSGSSFFFPRTRNWNPPRNFTLDFFLFPRFRSFRRFSLKMNRDGWEKRWKYEFERACVRSSKIWTVDIPWGSRLRSAKSRKERQGSIKSWRNVSVGEDKLARVDEKLLNGGGMGGFGVARTIGNRGWGRSKRAARARDLSSSRYSITGSLERPLLYQILARASSCYFFVFSTLWSVLKRGDDSSFRNWHFYSYEFPFDRNRADAGNAWFRLKFVTRNSSLKKKIISFQIPCQ